MRGTCLLLPEALYEILKSLGVQSTNWLGKISALSITDITCSGPVYLCARASDCCCSFPGSQIDNTVTQG